MNYKQMLGTGLALATVVGLAFPMASQAEVYSNEIIISPVTSSVAMPQLDVTHNSNLELHLSNFSPDPVTFSIPELDVSYSIPANSERLVYVDAATISAANLQPGQQVSYEILDASGNRLASGFVVNQQDIASMITTTEVSQTTTTTQTSEQVDVTPAPVVESQSTVRGFW